MQRNKTDPQKKLSREALAAKVKALTGNYLHAKQTFTHYFSALLWGIPLNEQQLDILVDFMERVKNEIAALEAILEEQQHFDNKFYILSLKMQVLLARYNLSGGDTAAAVTVSSGAVSELIELLENENFKFRDDEDFQEEMFFAFEMVLGKPKKNQMDELVAFQRKMNGVKFARKCSDSLTKLRFLCSFWFAARANGTLPVNDMKPCERTECTDTYDKVVAKLKKSLTDNPGNMRDAFSLTIANVLAYDIRNATHPSSIWKATQGSDLEKQLALLPSLTLEDREKYVSYAKDNIEKYLASSIKQLLQANPDDMRDNPDLLMDIVSGPLSSISRYVDTHALLFRSWLQQALPENLTHELKLLDLRLGELTVDLYEIYQTFQLSSSGTTAAAILMRRLLPTVPVIKSLEELEQTRKEFAQLREQATKNNDTHLAAKAIPDDEKKKLLHEWEEEENKHQEKTTARLKRKPKPGAAKKTDKERAQQVQFHFLTRAKYYARNRRHREAGQTYDLTYTHATKQNESLTRLAALDGQLFSYSMQIFKNVSEVNEILSFRVTSFKRMPNTQLNHLKQLADNISKDLEQLLKLHTLYNTMSYQRDVLTNPEIKEGIATSRRILAKRISKIKIAVDESKELFAKLNDILARRRENFIYRLGNGDFAAGLEEFKKRGEQKRKKNNKGSFTQEKEFISTLSGDFRRIHSTTTTLSSTYEEPMPETVALLKPIKDAFASIADIPGEHYLVGSSVISLLSGKNKIDAHDIDFLDLGQDDTAPIKKGFAPSKHVPFLYQKNGIDLTLSKAPSLKEEAQKRDFTICAVYIDKNGQRHDPLECGIDDIANKRLCMIGDPTKKLQEDPVRALRAIRYIMDGFTPDKKLETALASFKLLEKHQPQPGDIENRRQHLCDVAKKYLSRFNRKQFVSQLLKYDLLKKLFDISDKKADVALWKLEKMIGMKMPQKSSTPGFFAQRTQAQVKKSQELPAHFKLAAKVKA